MPSYHFGTGRLPPPRQRSAISHPIAKTKLMQPAGRQAGLVWPAVDYTIWTRHLIYIGGTVQQSIHQKYPKVLRPSTIQEPLATMAPILELSNHQNLRSFVPADFSVLVICTISFWQGQWHIQQLFGQVQWWWVIRFQQVILKFKPNDKMIMSCSSGA